MPPTSQPPPSSGGRAQVEAPDGRGAAGELFYGMTGAPRQPALPPLRKRLPYLALAVVNRVLPKNPANVVLHSTVDIEDGVLAIADECAARGAKATVLLEDPSRDALVRSFAAGPVRVVPKWSARGILTFLTARYVMSTSNIFGNRPPPSSQIMVSLWHGEPPTKCTARFEDHGGLNASYAPVCSTVGRAYRSAEFDIHPLRVPIVGAPRNDRMLQTDGSAVRRVLLGDDAARPAFLWMPSYRVGRYADGPRFDAVGVQPGVPYTAGELRQLDDWLVENDARMVVKLHHRDVNSFTEDYRAIRVLTKPDLVRHRVTVYQALAAFDALITDMSSVWVDYLLLDRPIVFAFPDVQHYRDGRGLNLEPYEHWVPGQFIQTMDELLAALGALLAGHDPMSEERARARRRFHQYHDDRSTARLLDGLGVGRASERD